MYKVSEFDKPMYRAGETAAILGVTTQTLHNYEKLGKLKMYRSNGGHRLVKREDLLSFLKEQGMLYDDTISRKRDVIYARVSSYEQKTNGDLDRQVMTLLETIPNLQNPLILKEVGSGLNDKRKQLLQLIHMVMLNNVRNVYITYEDRLTRFGYHYLETVFLEKGVKIIVLNHRTKEKDAEQELVNDMMSLIASFSGKLYGMRSGKNRKRG